MGWYLDGSHRNVTLIREFTNSRHLVYLSGSPDVHGAEIYHPRWSNRCEFLCVSGPYSRGTSPKITDYGFGGAEIHLGRFSPNMLKIVDWVRVTHNEFPDYFPAAWIAPDVKPPAQP